MDDNEQTNISNIFAIGYILEGKPELTPVAIQAGQLLAKRLYNNASLQVRDGREYFFDLISDRLIFNNHSNEFVSFTLEKTFFYNVFLLLLDINIKLETNS